MKKIKQIVSKKPFILIHTALYSEAKAIIDALELKQYDTKPFKIFKNNSTILVVSGIGKENTLNALSTVFDKYKILKAINIGTAGCSDKERKVGELFCTNHKLDTIDHMKLNTVNGPQTHLSSLITHHSLYDMEASHFEEFCKKYLDQKNILVFKVISDHLDDKIPKKEFVYKLISSSFEKWYNTL